MPPTNYLNEDDINNIVQSITWYYPWVFTSEPNMDSPKSCEQGDEWRWQLWYNLWMCRIWIITYTTLVLHTHMFSITKEVKWFGTTTVATLQIIDAVCGRLAREDLLLKKLEIIASTCHRLVAVFLVWNRWRLFEVCPVPCIRYFWMDCRWWSTSCTCQMRMLHGKYTHYKSSAKAISRFWK